MIYLYEIMCITKNHIYVGITSNIYRRTKEHRLGDGAKFTKIHGFKEIKIIDLFDDERLAKKAENKYVLFIREDTTKIVRGGGWTDTTMKHRKYK